MCGINGIYYFTSGTVEEQVIKDMNNTIVHRGPDNSGVFVKDQVGFGHVRLSIIDLSESGNQPMFSADNRFVLIFNGEIYNYQKIKSLLADYPFKTSTDSEVLLAAYAKWGKQMLEHLEGMFAFAIFDKADNSLFIARDRLGIKPIYYYRTNNYIIFSSEIRGLIASKLFTPQLDKNMLSTFFRSGTIAGDDTLLKEVKMLSPASFAQISGNAMTIQNYWAPALETNTEISYAHAKKEVRELFLQAVEKRLVADVPFGAFLSGGIDSTAVTAAMSTCLSGASNTFNICFAEAAFSESYYAKQVAKRFGTHHTEIKLSPNLFLEEIDHILQSYDHPSVDGANTYIVSQATRKAGITMALSGLGGDELFGGYPVFKQLQPTLQKLHKLPTPLRKVGSLLLKANPKVRNKKMGDLLALNNPDEAQVYETFRSIMSKRDCMRLTGNIQAIVNPKFFTQKCGTIDKITLAEYYHYLQPVLLRDTDQMSMKHALEVRVPFLDHKLVEFVLTLPDAYKTKTAVQKSLLVESLHDLLPSEIIHRKKMGFVLPWEQWLKNELATYVQDAIQTLQSTHLLNAKEWQSAFDDFKRGRQSYNWNIFWGLIVLTKWLKNNKISSN